MTQKDIVLNIVRLHQPIRTEQVKIMAMKEGCSCADRFLRWLAESRKGKIALIGGDYENGNKTKTWRTKQMTQGSLF